MEEKTQDILEYNLNINGIDLHVRRGGAGRHIISFADSNFKKIYESEDEWVYHEDNEDNFEEFFNISLKKENGAFAYVNESTSRVRFLERDELSSSYPFIREIVILIEAVKDAIEEKEKVINNNQSTKIQKTRDDDEER